MRIFVYTWLVMVLLIVLFHFVGMMVEDRMSEEHPFKKWWRKNVIDKDPNEK